MALTKENREEIINFVKKEPCLVQDIAVHIKKSWVTTESYVSRIAKETGMIRTKTFREGTKGAVKLVFWNYSESTQTDEIRKRLFEKIRLNANKKEFDPLEIVQFTNKNRVFTEYEASKTFSPFLRNVNEELLCFSGNLSWINLEENGKEMIEVLEELIRRNVMIKILCRVDVASINNLNKMGMIIKKYPKQIEIRHCRQPLRGFVADAKIARLKDEKSKADFKGRELEKDVRIFYEINDFEWVDWLQKVFWYLFRTSVDYEKRINILDKIVIE